MVEAVMMSDYIDRAETGLSLRQARLLEGGGRKADFTIGQALRP
jgi:hypothetical protein